MDWQGPVEPKSSQTTPDPVRLGSEQKEAPSRQRKARNPFFFFEELGDLVGFRVNVESGWKFDFFVLF